MYFVVILSILSFLTIQNNEDEKMCIRQWITDANPRMEKLLASASDQCPSVVYVRCRLDIGPTSTRALMLFCVCFSYSGFPTSGFLHYIIIMWPGTRFSPVGLVWSIYVTCIYSSLGYSLVLTAEKSAQSIILAIEMQMSCCILSC